MEPSVAEFYSQIILFLKCIDLGSKFGDPAPNGYEIITHGSNQRGEFVRFTYDSFNKEIGQEKLDLFDAETGLKNYRVHMGQVGEGILTALSGDRNNETRCFVLDKKYIDSYCGYRSVNFIELLGASIATIGCVPGADRASNVLYPLDRTRKSTYSTNITDQFNCESKMGVFGDKIVFKNKEEDVCREVNWAANHVWNAKKCAEDKYTLNSNNFQLFSINYLTIKFASGNCKEPTEPPEKFLESTYVKYIFDKNATRNATEEGSEDKTDWLAVGIGSGCSVVVLAIVGIALFFIIWCKCRKGRDHPALHVRYDFGVARNMRIEKKCPSRYNRVQLKSGVKILVPNRINGADVKRMVGQGRFGAFYEYQYFDMLYYYKFEAKLKSFKNPMAAEAGLMELVHAATDTRDIYIAYMFPDCGLYSEGLYYMRVEYLGPNIRDLRKGMVMEGSEVAKLAVKAIPCIAALTRNKICHRNIKESAFYFTRYCDETKLVVTDLGYAIRIGSERTNFYPNTLLATTLIHNKRASAVEDAESLLFMYLSMMSDSLPWRKMKKIELVTQAKKQFFEENLEGTSLENDEVALTFKIAWDGFMSFLTTTEPAEDMQMYLSAGFESKCRAQQLSRNQEVPPKLRFRIHRFVYLMSYYKGGQRTDELKILAFSDKNMLTYCRFVILIVGVNVISLSAQSRAATWKSALNFGPDFEKDWIQMGESSEKREPNAPRPKPEIAKESLRGMMSDEPIGSGNLASKNCFFSPVQCSFFYKRNYNPYPYSRFV